MKTANNIDEKHYPLTWKINSMLLIVHVGLLGLFWYLGVTAMVYVNVVSVSLYGALFFFYKRSIDQYIMIVFMEVLIHMALATLCTGLEAGFQLYSFCLIPCVFLCDYLGMIDGKPTKHPILVSVFIVVVFLGIRGYCLSYKAIYQLRDTKQYIGLFYYNAIVSFVFLTIYIAIFEHNILQREKKLGEMAEVDALTKLPNRYLMGKWLQEGYKESTKEKAMAVAMLDVDDFKKLNDKYGHTCGDLVLQTLAAQISSLAQDPIRVARWGGEEFLFMQTGESAYDKLREVLCQLQERMTELPILFNGEEIRITLTMGISKYHSTDVTYQDIIMRADDYMYEGKKNGKNRIVANN